MKNVLVIENDRDLLAIIKYVLQDAGYKVNLLKSKDSVAHIQQNHPRVILIDQWLSSGSGKNLCLQLKQGSGETKKAQVLLMGVKSRCAGLVKDCCTDAQYIKPFDINSLINTVNHWVYRSSFNH